MLLTGKIWTPLQLNYGNSVSPVEYITGSAKQAASMSKEDGSEHMNNAGVGFYFLLLYMLEIIFKTTVWNI